MNKLQQWLSTRGGTALCILFALANKFVFIVITSFIGRDKILQLHVAENILAGRGAGVLKYYPQDIYTPVLDRVYEFPPGYSFIITPFLKIFNHDYLIATTVLDLLIFLGFFFILRRLCRLAGFPLFLTNIVSLISGCFQYVFYMASAPTDALGLLLVFWGITVALSVYKNNKQLSSLSVFITSLLFFLPAFFRHIYLPLTIIIPLVTAALFSREKNISLMKQWLFLTCLTLVFTAGYLVFMKLYSGQALPQYPIERGFFPSNIIRWYPFIPASFINLDFAAQRAAQFTSAGYRASVFMFELLNIAAILFLIFSFRKIRRQFSCLSAGFRFYIFSGIAVSIMTVFILAYSSLTYSKETGPGSFWTFVYEERHWGFLYVFIQIAFTGWLYYTRHMRKKLLFRVLVAMLVVLLTTECLHGVYYNVKSLTYFPPEKKDAHWSFFLNYTRELKKTNPDTDILVMSPFTHFQYIAGLTGCKGLFDTPHSTNTGLRVNKKTILLVILPAGNNSQTENFYAGNSGKLIATINDITFIYHELYP